MKIATFSCIIISYVLSFMLIGCGSGSSNSSHKTSTNEPGDSNPPSYENLTIISKVNVGGYNDVKDVEISGNKVYIADSFDGLKIFDISDPANPRFIGFIDPYGSDRYSADNFYRIALSNNIAIAALIPGCSGFCYNWGGILRLYDVSHPRNPTFISTIDSYVDDVIADGNLIYITADESPNPYLFVIDISDPANPNIVGSTPIAAAGKLAKMNDMLYMSHGDFVQFLNVQVINVNNPSAPFVEGPNENGWVNVEHPSIAISNKIAYIADKTYGLEVVDVSDPSSINIIKNISTTSSVNDVFVYGNYLFVAEGLEVKVYDISDPMSPVFFKSIATQTTALKVRVSDGLGIIITAEVIGSYKEKLYTFTVGP